MSEPIFADGLIFKRPADKAPEFIKGKLSINVAEFGAFLAKHESNGWVNVDLKESKGGKLYFQLNEWKKGESKAPTKDKQETESGTIEYPTESVNPDDVPF